VGFRPVSGFYGNKSIPKSILVALSVLAKIRGFMG
jgi:hypothetical protein